MIMPNTRSSLPVAVVHGYFASKSAPTNIASVDTTDSAQFQLPAQTAMKEFFAGRLFPKSRDNHHN